jgi:hypothetical protein
MSEGRLRGLPSSAMVVPAERVKEKPKPIYTPKPVKASDWVQWFSGPDAANVGAPALVRVVATDTVDLVAFTHDGIRYVKGVRHVTDPRIPNLAKSGSYKTGCWDYSADTTLKQSIKSIIDVVAAQEEKINVLEECIASIMGQTVPEFRKQQGIGHIPVLAAVDPVAPPKKKLAAKPVDEDLTIVETLTDEMPDEE